MRILVLLLALTAGAPAFAQSPPPAAAQVPSPAAAQAPSGIAVQNAWARATAAPGAAGGVYLTIIDSGPPDRLVGASTPVAESAAVHQTIDDHGIMRMRPTGPIAVAAGKPVTLAPGGMHLMLIGLNHALHPGEHFPLILRFARAGAVQTDVTVQALGAAMPGMTMGAPAR